MPFSPLRLLLLFVAFIFLVAFVQLGILTIAFDKLGLSAHSAYLLFMTILVGSMINVPLFSVRSDTDATPETWSPRHIGPFRFSPPPFTGKTVVAVNVGGCVTPAAFSLYLMAHHDLNFFQVLLAIAAVTAVSYGFSRPIRGMGIGIPILIPPLAAALVSVVLSPSMSAPLAYISGTLGVLIGADILRLKDIRKLGAPIASIGGAGTFDGIFIAGIVAVLLA